MGAIRWGSMGVSRILYKGQFVFTYLIDWRLCIPALFLSSRVVCGGFIFINELRRPMDLCDQHLESPGVWVDVPVLDVIYLKLLWNPARRSPAALALG